MINIGDIYYLSDQFGSKFIKIISIGDVWDKNDNWVYFYRSVYLNSIVKVNEHNYSNSDCFKSNIKKMHFERLVQNLTYSGKFKGAILITQELINSKEKCLLTPFMTMSDDNRIICKGISKDEYRNLKLNRLLE